MCWTEWKASWSLWGVSNEGEGEGWRVAGAREKLDSASVIRPGSSLYEVRAFLGALMHVVTVHSLYTTSPLHYINNVRNIFFYKTNVMLKNIDNPL